MTARSDQPRQPSNPFAAEAVGSLYAHGRPFHHPRSLERIRAIAGSEPLQWAIDVACGTGMSTVALAEHASIVVGVDVSDAMLASARSAAGVHYSLANAEQLPFPDRTFDAVTVCSGIHWFDQAAFYREAARVLRSDGWLALYDHYFLGEMIDVPEFGTWTSELLQRFPLPPRNRQVGDPRAEKPDGYVVIGEETFVDDIPMTADAFADYQLTISNLVSAAEGGTPRAELRQWLLDSTASMFDGVHARTVRFLGSIICLRPQ